MVPQDYTDDTRQQNAELSQFERDSSQIGIFFMSTLHHFWNMACLAFKWFVVLVFGIVNTSESAKFEL